MVSDLKSPYFQVEICESKILMLIDKYTKSIKSNIGEDVYLKIRMTDHITEKVLAKNFKFPGQLSYNKPLCGFKHVTKDTAKFYGFDPILSDGTNAGLKPSSTDESNWVESVIDYDLVEVRQIVVHGNKENANIG